jgi:hypothetical protein
MTNRAAISDVVKSLENAWRDIASRHDELPGNTSIVVASRGRRQLNGYHMPQRWKLTEGAAGEVMIAAEGLNRGGTAIFTTLLHEAVHAVAWARGVKDTSQNGRYHNRRFARLAFDMGLQVEEGAHGYDTVGLYQSTRTKYSTAIEEISRAATLYRGAEPNSTPGPNKNLLKATCVCQVDNSIRTSRRRLDKGLVCPDCGTYFTEVKSPVVPNEEA